MCDTEPEEIQRGISLTPTIAPFEWKASDGQTYTINLIDAPGAAYFAGGMDVALSVADLAVVVVSAVDGVEVGTEAGLAAGRRGRHPEAGVHDEGGQAARRLPPRARASARLRRLRSRRPRPGEEESFHPLAELPSDTGYDYDADGSHHGCLSRWTSPPRRPSAPAGRRGDRLGVIMSNFSATCPRGEAVDAVGSSARPGAPGDPYCQEFPVLVGSAVSGVGIDRLAHFSASRPVPGGPRHHGRRARRGVDRGRRGPGR